MKHTVLLSLMSLTLLCGPLRTAETGKPVKPASTTTAKTDTSATAGRSLASPEAVSNTRVVRYGERDVVQVRAKLRYTTLIVLPKTEQILDFTCGDKEFWMVNGSQNFAYVKPAKVGSGTNVNLITASGNVYSFALTEISEKADAQPDLKVFVEPKEESMLAALNGSPRFVPVGQVEDYRLQAETARAEAREAKQQAQLALERETARLRSDYPGSLRFPYRFDKGKRPFEVTGMYHDGKFTYIQANAQETPALYELKDGKPNLIQFEFKDGTYTVAKVLDSGYLSIGKERLHFIRQQ